MKKLTLNYVIPLLYFFCNGVHGANGSGWSPFNSAHYTFGLQEVLRDLACKPEAVEGVNDGLCDEEATACSEVAEDSEEMPDFRVLRRNLARKDKKELAEAFVASGLSEDSLRAARKQYYEDLTKKSASEFYFFYLIVHMSSRKPVNQPVCFCCGYSFLRGRSTFANEYFPIADNDTSDEAKKYKVLYLALQEGLKVRVQVEDKFKRAIVWALPPSNLIPNVSCRRCISQREASSA